MLRYMSHYVDLSIIYVVVNKKGVSGKRIPRSKYSSQQQLVHFHMRCMYIKV